MNPFVYICMTWLYALERNCDLILPDASTTGPDQTEAASLVGCTYK